MTDQAINSLAATLPSIIGRATDEPEVKTILSSIGSWPVPAFKADEFDSGHVDQARGFEIGFRAAMALEHPRVTAKGRTPVVASGIFYAGGKDGISRFEGALPLGITWADSAETLPSKLGEASTTVRNKKTGGVKAYRWPADNGLEVEAVFQSDGSLAHVHLGLAS